MAISLFFTAKLSLKFYKTVFLSQIETNKKVASSFVKLNKTLWRQPQLSNTKSKIKRLLLFLTQIYDTQSTKYNCIKRTGTISETIFLIFCRTKNVTSYIQN